MAEVVVLESSAHSSFPFGKVQADVKMKRKTPSELRSEQLKRRNAFPRNVELASLQDSNRVDNGVSDGIWKPEPSKNPKLIDTRVDEVYPIKKSSERCRLLYGKVKPKDAVIDGTEDPVNPSIISNFSAENKMSFQCDNVRDPSIQDCLDPFAKDQFNKYFRKIEKCSQSTLRDVVGLHVGGDKSDSSKVDMEKALKGLVARDLPVISASLGESSQKIGDIPKISSGIFPCEHHIKSSRPPLDFTLKTSLQLVSSSSVKWCHTISTNPANIGMIHSARQFGCKRKQNFGCNSASKLPAEVLYSNALSSWAYPQSSLPPSLISTISTIPTLTGKGEMDFLAKRQQDWEDSFQCLYYMLRKNACDIFYVYTSQFVVLFIGGNLLGKKKRSCNAYLSQSTRGLRSLLKKHDICFSMPLCHAEVEQATEDDLVELSEIKKLNFGQTFQVDSAAGVDNTPQSLLAFIGNKNVHSLYGFLLNYRHFLNSLAGVDVPVLHSPEPFLNASLWKPQLRCKEMKRADLFAPALTGSNTEETISGSLSTGFCYSIEIKDDVLPPWVVCRLCAAMISDGRHFESSFTTDPASLGLNIALDSVCPGTDPPNNSLVESDNDPFGIPEAVLSPCLRSASLRHLKYADGWQVAYVTQV